MLPYYKESLEKGEITREDALELLECFYIKLSEIIKIYDNKTAKYFGGFPQGQIIVVGGQTTEGLDATNDLSYLCLEAMMDVKTRQPNLAVRLHRGSPDDFVLRACEVAKVSNAQPEFFNDEIVIPALLNVGVPIEEARNYAVCGCVEIAIPGKTNTWGVAAMVNFAKCLELTLNNGKSMLNDKQIGPTTGDPREFKSFDDLMHAFKLQMEYVAKLVVIAQNCIQSAHAELAPQPFVSAFISDCIEKGEDFICGGARYNFSGSQGVGVASVADSLASLKKLVFEEKIITMSKLLEALRNNFQGEYEELRFLLLTRAPKFGNDDDYVDLIAREIGRIHCLSYSKYRDARGGIYTPGMLSNTAGIMFGEAVAATPDGRRFGEPLSDGVSPVAGRDVNGPTAAFKSVAKLDLALCPQGAVLNMKLNPTLLSGREKLIKFANIIRSYFELGGFHVQFNIIDDKILRRAQREPEKYKDLLVRVAGWCAYFVELAKPVQDEIIRRTMHQKI
jgi:formate C-acetyltransferase